MKADRHYFYAASVPSKSISISFFAEIIPFEPASAGKVCVLPSAQTNAESADTTMSSLVPESQDSESGSGRVTKRSAQSASITNAPDNKRGNGSYQDANRREAPAPVHIELISDDDDVLHDV